MRFVSQVWPGDTLTARATVEALRDEDGEQFVDLTVVTTNQNGQGGRDRLRERAPRSVAREPRIDPAKLEAFVNKALGDLGAALTAALVGIGDKLGLYNAMAGAGPLTSSELAQRTGTHERSVREWLAAQAAAGYVDYHPR